MSTSNPKIVEWLQKLDTVLNKDFIELYNSLDVIGKADLVDELVTNDPMLYHKLSIEHRI